MKKHIAKSLRTIAEQNENVFGKESIKRKYKQLKKAWKYNVKNVKRND